jgi:hypothetical protein
LNDPHDWSVGGPVQVVVRDTTRAGGNLRLGALYALDGRVRFDHLQASTRASYLARNLFQTRILSKFVLPSRATVAFTSQSDYFSPEFQKKFPRNLGLITLSGVGLGFLTPPLPKSTLDVFGQANGSGLRASRKKSRLPC